MANVQLSLSFSSPPTVSDIPHSYYCCAPAVPRAENLGRIFSFVLHNGPQDKSFCGNHFTEVISPLSLTLFLLIFQVLRRFIYPCTTGLLLWNHLVLLLSFRS